MDFFAYQAAARKSSRRLVWMLLAAVVAIVVVIDLAIVLLFSQRWSEAEAFSLAWTSDVAPTLVAVSLLVVAVIGIASIYKTARLRQGGSVVARELGGERLPDAPQDLAGQRLRNVVEEIAIASMVPVPEIYVLEDEGSINAFAAGWSPQDAAIAVTRGAMKKLNRDELQGVIAHEFAHVLNGDMRLNIRLMGLVFGILVLSLIGRKVLVHTRGGRREGGAIIIVALVLTVVGSIGLLFARLIKAGVSRQRELLADASAVQFTRQSSGLAGALKKIAGIPEGSRIEHPEAEDVSHMLFGEGRGRASWFATHPPLGERIRLLDPSFLPSMVDSLAGRFASEPPDGLAEDVALGFARAPAALGPEDRQLIIDPDKVSAQVGNPAGDDYARAGVLCGALPVTLTQAVRNPDEALAVIFALVVDRTEHAIGAAQMKMIGTGFGAAVVAAVANHLQAIATLHAALRLPLAMMAFPALKRRPRNELHRMVDVLDQLIHADRRVDLSEYCLARLLERQVIEALDPSRHRPAGRKALRDCVDEIQSLLSVFAQMGHTVRGESQRAFAIGIHRIFPQDTQFYAPPPDFIATLDQALPKLDALDFAGKELLIEGLVAAASHDGRISVAEMELVRCVCAYLHCPLPAAIEICLPPTLNESPIAQPA